MAIDFGWAYVSGSNFLGPFSGTDKAIQFRTGTSQLSGNADFTYDPAGKHMKVTGSITVSGDGRTGGFLGMDGNKRLIDYQETFPSNCVGEVYGPITIGTGGTLIIEASSHMVIKTWPY